MGRRDRGGVVTVTRSQIRALRKVADTWSDAGIHGATLKSITARGWIRRRDERPHTRPRAQMLTQHGRDVLDAYDLGGGHRGR